MSDCTQALKERIAQLEAEPQAMRRHSLSQRQRLAYKYGQEFLALIEGAPDARVPASFSRYPGSSKARCNRAKHP